MTVSAHPITALLADSPLHSALADSKPEVLAQTQNAYDALYCEPQALPAATLHAFAAVVAAQQGSDLLYAHHLGAGADRELVAAALAGEAAEYDALLTHLDIVSVSPALAAPGDQEALAAAGVSPDLVVLISQLVAYESYLTRMLAGAQALAEAAEGSQSTAPGCPVPAAAVSSMRIPVSRGRRGERSDRTADGTPAPTDFTQQMLDWEPWVPAPAEDALTEAQIASFAAKSGTGSVYFRLISRTPGVTAARSALDNEVFLSKTGLPKGERELAATVSSKVNDCVYCASVHARKATQRTKRSADVERLLAVTLPRSEDWVADSVDDLALGQDERWSVLIESAARLSALVPMFASADVDRLREIGLSDLEIADLVASTAFFGWANRLMLTLGEPAWPAAE